MKINELENKLSQKEVYSALKNLHKSICLDINRRQKLKSKSGKAETNCHLLSNEKDSLALKVSRLFYKEDGSLPKNTSFEYFKKINKQDYTNTLEQISELQEKYGIYIV